MISLIRDSQKKNLRISNFIKKGKIRATSKHKNLLVLIKKYHSSGVTKSITVKPFSNKDVNQLCFEILVLHYKVLSGKGCRQQASFPHDSPFQNTFFCKKKGNVLSQPLAFVVFTDDIEEDRLYSLHSYVYGFKNNKIKLSFCAKEFKQYQRIALHINNIVQ